ncbi:hypothetical protein MCOR17_004937 [Pyricularia oryzae]|nr:hypothetical protein MCOR17_004937 [Pyricularia oryzae]
MQFPVEHNGSTETELLSGGFTRPTYIAACIGVYCRKGCANVVARLSADVVGDIPCNVSWRKGCAKVVVRLNDGVAGDVSCTVPQGKEVPVSTVLKGGVVVAGVPASPVYGSAGFRSSMRAMILGRRSMSPRK